MSGQVIQRIFWIVLLGAFWLALIAGFVYAPYITRLIDGKKKSISIFVWSDLIDPSIIKEFEQQTGVRVFVNYYEGNDELLTKLRFAHGMGYDLFIPSHYVIKALIKDELIKKINKERLEFWHDIDPRFLSREYDPDNDYTIPYIWDVYGMGVNTGFFAEKPIESSWRMLFEPPFYYRVGMTNEPREVVSIASLYLYGSMKLLDQKRKMGIELLLMNQKKFVEAYTDLNTDFLLTSRACAVVLAPNNAVHRARKQTKDIAFVLPREGTVMALESIVIAATSTKDDLIYAFINFLFKHESIKKTCERYGDLPVLKRDLGELKLDYLDVGNLLGDYFKTIQLIVPLMARHELFEFWLSLKAY